MLGFQGGVSIPLVKGGVKAPPAKRQCRAAPKAVARHWLYSTAKATLGIGGRPNIILPFHAISGQPNKNGNDGTFGRFGWKAQNKSLLVFSGEAYNVEMGITNEAFQTERDETA